MEAFLILFANTVTIIVFWKRRFQLRKTSVVLINLSVADLLVGVGAIEEFMGFICSLSWFKTYLILREYSSCASNSLVLVSLERVYAIVWPFRSRTTSTRTYIYAVGVVWLISEIAPTFSSLSVLSEHLPLKSLFMAWIALPGCLPDNNSRCIFCYLVLFQKARSKTFRK